MGWTTLQTASGSAVSSVDRDGLKGLDMRIKVNIASHAITLTD